MLVCMYVCKPKIVKFQFFYVFFSPTVVLTDNFPGSQGRKIEKCQFLWSMYACKAKTNNIELQTRFIFTKLFNQIETNTKLQTRFTFTKQESYSTKLKQIMQN